MTYAGCGKRTKSGKHRKHTEVVSQKQARLFGAKAGGAKTKAKGLSVKEAKRHLRRRKIKKLPARKGWDSKL